MCDAMLVGMGAQGIGTLMQASALKSRGQAAKTAADINGFYAEQAAGDAVYRGTLKDLQTAMQGSAVIAEQKIAFSGSGVDMNTGGAAATQRASQAVIEVNRAIVRRNAALEAYGLRSHAQAQFQQGEYAEAEGDSAALGTLLGGIGKIGVEGMKLKGDQTGISPTDFVGDGSYGGGSFADEAD